VFPKGFILNKKIIRIFLFKEEEYILSNIFDLLVDFF